MNTYQIMNQVDALSQDGAPFAPPALAASALPVLARPAGVALALALEESEIVGEDLFALVLVDRDGATLTRLGPFSEEDVVAVWRDLSAKSGLPRMIVREDGSVSPVSRQLGRVALGTTRQRRRHGLMNGRRPRFLVRRKTARLPARPQIHRGENEIIARN